MATRSTFSNKVSQAWGLRLARQIEECRMLVFELSSQVADATPKERGDFLILRASIRRADNDPLGAAELLDQVEKEFPEVTRGFCYQYERAFLVFNRGEYNQALDRFLAAYYTSQETTDRAVALINALVCFDALGMPFSEAEKDLKVLLPAVESKRVKELIENTLVFLEAHREFRSGNKKRIDQMRKDFHSGVWGQLTYLFEWLKRLPYFEGAVSQSPEAPVNFDLGGYHGVQRFRLRTLQGITHPDDELVTNPYEFADRLYLWSWRWLVSGDSSVLDRVLPLFGKLLIECPVHRLTVEDQKLVRNSLLWLSLFDAEASRGQISRLLRRFTDSSQMAMPLLDFEALCVQWMLAVRDGKSTRAQDYLQWLSQDPLWHSGEVFLAKLVQAIASRKSDVPSHLSGLCVRLSNLISPDRRERDGKIVVNLVKGEIDDAENMRKIVSAPLTVALDLFHNRESISCAELIEACFGITRYDPIIHNTKLFNLLSRLKGLVGPELSFHMKSGTLYARGNWSGVRFVGVSDSHSPLAGKQQWRSLLGSMLQHEDPSGGNKPVPPAALVFKKGRLLRRHDFEQDLHVPRSTANRLIAEWVRSGVLVKKGNGRNTFYVPTAQFQFESRRSP